MMRSVRMVAFWSLALAIACAGCDREEDTYGGKPVSAWLKLAKDKDHDTRVTAIRALGGISSPESDRALAEAATTDDSDAVRLIALEESWQRLNERELLSVLTHLINVDSREGAPSYAVEPAFIASVKRLGPAAAPLLPALRADRAIALAFPEKVRAIDEMIAAATRVEASEAKKLSSEN